MIPVEYNANNSGGRDWLTDKDWKALQDAGWKLFGFDDFAYRDGDYIPDKDGLPSRKDEVPVDEQDESKPGDGSFDSAYKNFNNIQEAIKEFEELTGQDVTKEGCNCCGAPHNFTWGKDIVVRVDVDKQDYHYASGEELLEYIYPDKNTKLSKWLLGLVMRKSP